jgi:uncharacterized integral membrane protein
MTAPSYSETQIYQGEFGQFTITDSDRLGVIIYRSGLILATLSFTIGSILILSQGKTDWVINSLTPLFAIFALSLGVSLATIHIYLISLHRLLQIFWGIGTISAIFFTFYSQQPLALFIYQNPTSLIGIGFLFVALTGIFFKEAFCFNRLETKFLTPLVPMLLLGHLFGIISVSLEQIMLATWVIFFLIFAFRKAIQPIPPDIGDKSVFEYLKKQNQASV